MSNAKTHSKRMEEGKLSVKRKRCPFCGHRKALRNQSVTKCSKCGKVI